MIKNNGGDGNFGGTGTIAIVDNEGTIIETIQEATEDYDFYGFENWLGST